MYRNNTIRAKERLQNIMETMGTPSKAMDRSTVRANRSELNPLHFLPRSSSIYPTKVAVVYEDRKYTYKDLNRRSLGLAYALKDAYGIGDGDVVVVIAPNIPAMLEANFGIPATGGIICSINTRLAHDEVEYILEHSGAKLVLCDAEFSDLVKGLELPTIFIEDTGLMTNDPYERFISSGFVKADTLGWDGLPPINDEENAISLCYTSGTTGKPKGVLSTYRGLYLTALGNAVETRLTSESSFLFIVPYFHANSWGFPFAMAATGGKFVLLRKVNYDTIWNILLNENITHLNGAPTIMIQIGNHPHAVRMQHPLNCTVAGSAPSAALLARMKELNMTVNHSFGMTETQGASLICCIQPWWDDLEIKERAKYLSRQGCPVLIADSVRVVDQNMNDVASDGKDMGEIVIRGNMVMKGYLNNPEATEQAFKGGWFHSGDLADRAKDIIISGGENISTLEVEACISFHPSVLEVAVVSTPSEKWGESPKAFVVLKPGLPEEEIVDGAALRVFCKKHMARYKCPSSIEIVHDIPKTSTGKIQKSILREREWKGVARH
ncbi:hypothetical protein BGZ76_004132, partial [Entomortierella beljakovae]